LDKTFSNLREKDIRASEKLLQPRGINDEGASTAHFKVVTRDNAAAQIRQSLSFSGSEVGLLEAKDVVFF
jgi:hypothetical protein